MKVKMRIPNGVQVKLCQSRYMQPRVRTMAWLRKKESNSLLSKAHVADIKFDGYSSP